MFLQESMFLPFVLLVCVFSELCVEEHLENYVECFLTNTQNTFAPLSFFFTLKD